MHWLHYRKVLSWKPMVATEKGASCFVLVIRDQSVMSWFTVVAVFSRIGEIHDEQWTVEGNRHVQCSVLQWRSFIAIICAVILNFFRCKIFLFESSSSNDCLHCLSEWLQKVRQSLHDCDRISDLLTTFVLPLLSTRVFSLILVQNQFLHVLSMVSTLYLIPILQMILGR